MITSRSVVRVEFTSVQQRATFELLDSCREQVLSFLGKRARTHDPETLFISFMGEIRRVLIKLRRLRREAHSLPVAERLYPEEALFGIIHESSRIVREALGHLEDLAQDRRLDGLNREQVSQLVVQDAKEVSERMLEQTTFEGITYETFPAETLLSEIREVVPGLVLPEGNYAYKGGISRLALKLLARRMYPDRMNLRYLNSEIPPSDFDCVVGPDVEDVWAAANSMNVDASGIEKRKHLDLSTPESRDVAVRDYLANRDIDANETLLDSNRLYYTKNALESVLTGVIHPRTRAVSLFGRDTFWRDDREYLTSRTIHRLIKMIIDEKAKEFVMPRYNFDVPLGIYWLVLARKWYGKPGFGRRLAGLYLCAKRMGQTEAASPAEFLLEVRGKNPQFSFLNNQTAFDVARWVLSKWYVLVHKHIRTVFGVHDPDSRYTLDDTREERISFDDEGVESVNAAPAEQLIHAWIKAEEGTVADVDPSAASR